ncbi:hypothetical protein [Arthrobacter sp. AFG7.2]|uniref:hypothetical protein n=1 Tax=Arthrobacter sp. AFG7.2 TaxID=1688693 RepID=UPI0011AF4983|nr:hypothetical protein [Arthrobacter sp. AFG7.2]
MNSLPELPDSRTMSAVLRWVTFYTRFTPARVAQERYDELRSDLYEQFVDGKRQGLSRGSIDRAIAGRALRGLAADLSWSRKQLQRKETNMSNPQAASEPTNGPVTIRLSSLVWFVLTLLAGIGLATSITELVEYGGNRFGFVPWPGAGNIKITLVQLGCSAVLLVPATIITVKRLIKHHARNA